MKVTNATRRALKLRREERWRLANGWQRTEADWELHRGMKQNWRVAEVKISVDGKHVLFRTEPNPMPYPIPYGTQSENETATSIPAPSF